ncbi:hypothetical protein, partial [Alienimonas chondri]|uniref:hypothetical protein n=1 Tax=Alienimonas chondri TaxID=2681879 RepID=UPI0019D54344
MWWTEASGTYPPPHDDDAKGRRSVLSVQAEAALKYKLEYVIRVDTRKAKKDVDSFLASSSGGQAAKKTAVRDERDRGDVLRRLRREFHASIDAIEAKHGSQAAQFARRSRIAVSRELANGFGRDETQLRKHLTRIVAEERRAAREINAIHHARTGGVVARRSGGRGGAGGRPGGGGVQMAFQAQQMVEDFSFAGMRGATNNLAMMAATLGSGPASLAVLGGIAAVQMVDVIARLQGTEEAAEGARAKVSALASALGSVHSDRLAAVPDRSPGQDLLSVDLHALEAKRAAAEARRAFQEERKLHSAVAELDAMRQTQATWATGGEAGLHARRRAVAEQIEASSGGVHDADQLMSWAGVAGQDNPFAKVARRGGESGKTPFDLMAEQAKEFRDSGDFEAGIEVAGLERAAEIADTAADAFGTLWEVEARLAAVPPPSVPDIGSDHPDLVERTAVAWGRLARGGRDAELSLATAHERLESSLAAPEGPGKWEGVVRMLQTYRRTASEVIEVRKELARGESPELDRLRSEATFRDGAVRSIDDLAAAAESRIDSLEREAEALDRVVERTEAAA